MITTVSEIFKPLNRVSFKWNPVANQVLSQAHLMQLTKVFIARTHQILELARGLFMTGCSKYSYVERTIKKLKSMPSKRIMKTLKLLETTQSIAPKFKDEGTVTTLPEHGRKKTLSISEVELFTPLLFDLFIFKFPSFANTTNLHWGLNNFECKCKDNIYVAMVELICFDWTLMRWLCIYHF